MPCKHLQASRSKSYHKAIRTIHSNKTQPVVRFEVLVDAILSLKEANWKSRSIPKVHIPFREVSQKIMAPNEHPTFTQGAEDVKKQNFRPQLFIDHVGGPTGDDRMHLHDQFIVTDLMLAIVANFNRHVGECAK